MKAIEELERKIVVKQNLATPCSTDWYYYQGCLDTVKKVKNLITV